MTATSGRRGAAAWLPIGLFVVSLIYVARSFMPARDPASDYHFNAFGRLPVVHDGRIKPKGFLHPAKAATGCVSADTGVHHTVRVPAFIKFFLQPFRIS